jgi:hypothetical protein
LSRREDAARSDARARRRFGNLTIQSERTRERDLIAWLDHLVGDVRYALRGLRNAPAFALVAVLSLALGIGANTAIFSLLNVALFKTLPVSHPEELVQITDSGDPGSKNASTFNAGAWRYIREHQDMFTSVFAYGSTGSADLSTGGESRPIRRVSSAVISLRHLECCQQLGGYSAMLTMSKGVAARPY